MWRALRHYWGTMATRVVPMFGNLTSKELGVSADGIKMLRGQIDHFYHLAAVYDLGADEARQIAANIDGTRQAVELAKAIEARHFHHVSSVAGALVALDWPGGRAYQYCAGGLCGGRAGCYQSSGRDRKRMLSSGGPGGLPRGRCA